MWCAGVSSTKEFIGSVCNVGNLCVSQVTLSSRLKLWEMLLVTLLCFVTLLLIGQTCLLWMVVRGIVTLGPTKIRSESAKTQTQTVWEKTESEHQPVKLVSTPRSRHRSPDLVFVAPAAGEIPPESWMYSVERSKGSEALLIMQDM